MDLSSEVAMSLMNDHYRGILYKWTFDLSLEVTMYLIIEILLRDF